MSRRKTNTAPYLVQGKGSGHKCVSCRGELDYGFDDGSVFPCMTYDTISLKLASPPKDPKITTSKKLFRNLIKDNPFYVEHYVKDGDYITGSIVVSDSEEKSMMAIINSVVNIDYPLFEDTITKVMRDYISELGDKYELENWNLMHRKCFEKLIKGDNVSEKNYLLDKKRKKISLEGKLILPWNQFRKLPLSGRKVEADNLRKYIDIKGSFLMDYLALSELPKKGQTYLSTNQG